MKIFLHIGPPKTGNNFLRTNVFLKIIEANENIEFNDPILFYLLRDLFVAFHEKQNVKIKKLKKKISLRIKVLDKKFKLLILSYDFLSMFFESNKNYSFKLYFHYKIIKEIFPKSKIIIVSRKIDEIAASLYKHNLNRNSKIYNFKTFKSYKKKYLFIEKFRKEYLYLLKINDLNIIKISFVELKKNPYKVFRDLLKFIKPKNTPIFEKIIPQYNRGDSIIFMQRFFFFRHLQFFDENSKYQISKFFLLDRNYNLRTLFKYRSKILEIFYNFLNLISIKQNLIKIYNLLFK